MTVLVLALGCYDSGLPPGSAACVRDRVDVSPDLALPTGQSADVLAAALSSPSWATDNVDWPSIEVGVDSSRLTATHLQMDARCDVPDQLEVTGPIEMRVVGVEPPDFDATLVARVGDGDVVEVWAEIQRPANGPFVEWVEALGQDRLVDGGPLMALAVSMQWPERRATLTAYFRDPATPTGTDPFQWGLLQVNPYAPDFVTTFAETE